MKSATKISRAGHIIRLLRSRIGPELIDDAIAGDEDWIRVDRDVLVFVLSFVRTDPDAALCTLVDLTGIDHGPNRPGAERFEVLYRLKSSTLGYRLAISVWVPDDDLVIPSATPQYAAANWLERELWDLFGISVDGHPYLRRLLLYPGFAGHPLRRDYPRNKVQPLVPLRESTRERVIVRPQNPSEPLS